MPWFASRPLTLGGRPKYSTFEVELIISTECKLYEGEQKVSTGASVIVTSHRVLFLDPHSGDRSTMSTLDLSAVSAVEHDHPWFRWPRVRLRLQRAVAPAEPSKGLVAPTGSSAAGAAAPAASVNPPSPGYVMVGFETVKERDKFSSLLQSAHNDIARVMRQEADYLSNSASSAGAAGAGSALAAGAAAGSAVGAAGIAEGGGDGAIAPAAARSTGVGIAGIMRRVEQQQRRTDKDLEVAFSDLTSLMEHAGKVVQLADKITASHQRRAAEGASPGSSGAAAAAGAARGGPGTGAGEDAEAEQQAYMDLMVSMGLSSPVTRAAAGSAFHEQLSRQLVDFLERPLQLYGGIMTLTDVYSLYCRARGTELVSPEDVLTAARRWTALGLPLRLKTFRSGLIAVHSADLDDAKLGGRVLDVIARGGSSGSSGSNVSSSPSSPAPSDVSARWPRVGVTTQEVCKALKLSPVIVSETLRVLEFESRRVCRDESASGVRYFANLFPSFAATKAAAAAS